MALIPAAIDPTLVAGPLLINQTSLLLSNPHLPFEFGFALNSDGMWHVAAETFMPNVTGEMIEWWFGHVRTTEQYAKWHPRDHAYSEWSGPSNGQYIGGKHLIYEYIGGVESKLRVSFVSPSIYFGSDWENDFRKYNISTAICGRAGIWDGKGHGDSGFDIGHLIHLVHEECNGCSSPSHVLSNESDVRGVRMRSRFWLGDIAGLTDPVERSKSVPPGMPKGLAQHSSEEMTILGRILPDLYAENHGPKRRKDEMIIAKSRRLRTRSWV